MYIVVYCANNRALGTALFVSSSFFIQLRYQGNPFLCFIYAFYSLQPTCEEPLYAKGYNSMNPTSDETKHSSAAFINKYQPYVERERIDPFWMCANIYQRLKSRKFTSWALYVYI